MFELPSYRQTKVKRKNAKSQSRYVVRMGLCLGQRYREADVNLTDRSNYGFPLLVGRGFLAGEVLVDSGSSYTVAPDCRSNAAK